MKEPSSEASKELSMVSGRNSLVLPVFKSTVAIERRDDMRLSSSQERKGSLLECTTTGPLVSRLNWSPAFLRHSTSRSVNMNFELSASHSISEFSAAYLPEGTGTSRNFLAVRSHATGS